MTELRAYCASLSDYNAGRLVGEWIDLDDDPEVMNEAIQAMLKTSREPNAEEWAWHDFEGPGTSLLGEFSPVADLCRLASIVNERDADTVSVAAGISDGLDSLDRACERYQGVFTSQGDFAHARAEEIGDLESIPDMYRNAIDWDSIARDYDCDGWYFVETGYQECHVFEPDY